MPRTVAIRPAPSLHEQVGGEPGEVHRPAALEVGLLRLGEHQQIVDHTAHPVELVQDDGDGLGPVVRVVTEQFQMPADNGLFEVSRGGA